MSRHKQLAPNILEAALAGLEAQRQRIEQHIAEVSKQLGRGRAKRHAPAGEAAPKPRRKMTAAARKRIAAAQKRRWAEFRKKHAEKK